ncbi:hypothetical protein DP116_15835 [Brasilonema bromeliae SPC951]|uniref:Uncharacterized protein n=1 Tax=Brasilonema bromeliae SPC951 TaxID=385972 RepID=A0ABX1PB69_9CYAN|nr:hypothetical protein [Brasilonema bromeliae SPC951]
MTEERQRKQGQKAEGIKNFLEKVSPLFFALWFQAPKFIYGKGNKIYSEMHGMRNKASLLQAPNLWYGDS